MHRRGGKANNCSAQNPALFVDLFRISFIPNIRVRETDSRVKRAYNMIYDRSIFMKNVSSSTSHKKLSLYVFTPV